MSRARRYPASLVAALCVPTLLSAACGASPEVRLEVAGRGNHLVTGTAATGTNPGGDLPAQGSTGGVVAAGSRAAITSNGAAAADPSVPVGTTSSTTGALAAPSAAPAGGNGGATDIGVTATEIKIGGTFFNGGFLDKYSRSVEEAASAYFNLINDNGGIFGRKITYDTCDTQGTAEGTQQCVRRLVEQDKAFVLGPGLDFNMDTVAGYIAQKKMPWVGTAGLYDAEWDSPWIFPTQLRGGAVGNLMTTFVANTLHKKRLAISQLRNGAGPACTKEIRSVAAKLGLTVTYVAENNDTESDLTDRVIATRNTNPDVVVFCNDPVNNIKFQQSASRLGWKPVFIQGFGTADDVPQAIGSSAEGMYGFTPYDHYDVQTKAMLEYRKVTSFYFPNTFPFSYSVASWAGAQAVVQALLKAGPDLTRTKFLAAVRNLKTFDVGLGLSFDFGSPDEVCPPTGHFVQVRKVDGALRYVPVTGKYAGTGGC